MRLEFEVSRVSADLADTFRPADTQGCVPKGVDAAFNARCY